MHYYWGNEKIQNRLIASADYGPKLAYIVTQRLINENSSLTALFVADYEMAFSSLKAIKDLKKGYKGYFVDFLC